MIRHIVLFQFKPDTPEEEKAKLVKNLEALFDSIKEIEAFESGTNCSHENLDRGFTHIFLLTFKDEAARDTYVDHAEHKKFIEENLASVGSILVVDYANKGPLSR